MRTRIQISLDSVPVLPKGVRLHFDRVRQAHVLLAPERVLTPDEIGIAILERCDGSRSVERVSAALAEAFEAERSRIERDVIALLQRLADQGYVRA